MGKFTHETFDVEGIDDVARALAQMGDVERLKSMRAGFDEASAFILRDMRSRVSRDGGDLASNLTRVVHVRGGKVTSAEIGPRSKNKKDQWWSARARWLERGTRSGKTIKPRAKGEFRALSPRAAGGSPVASAEHRGMQAQPFMRPSIDNNVEKIAEIMLDAIRRAVKIAGFTVR